ncbi:MAG: heavy metal translocating P-type ATPase [Caldicoprobacterales bacterium]
MKSALQKRKKFYLEGLACASCAATIEDRISRMDTITSASVNFADSSLSIELRERDRLEDTLAQIREIVDSVEPGVRLVKGEQNEKGEDSSFFSRERIILGLGILGFIGAILMPASLGKTILFILAYLVIGGRVLLLAGKNITRGRVFDENFLMTIATLGAIGIGEYPEAVSVMLFYRIGEEFQEAAVNRSRRSIKSLINIKPDRANLLVNGDILTVSPEKLKLADTIILRPGERAPVDSRVIEGRSELDVSALTGESMPEPVEPGDQVLSGSINTSGLLTLRVEKLFTDSTVTRILDLVENASSKKAPTEQFISRFAKVYTPIVVLLALALATVPPLLVPGAIFSDWLYRGLVFLVVSCPCALVISIPLSFFAGIGGASRRGILVKGGNSLQALKDVDTVVFDKTGTLTKGTFEVVGISPASGIDEKDLLRLAAMGEYHSNHPLARSIISAYGQEIDKDKIQDYKEIPGKGTCSFLAGEPLLVGNKRLMKENHILVHEQAGSPLTDDSRVHVAYAGRYYGYLDLADGLKADTRAAVDRLRSLGVKRIGILSGDREPSVKHAASKAGISEYYYGLLPHEKVERLEQMIKDKRSGKLAFVGDGLNDAPVLAMADVGIVMGNIGSDTAVEAADVVLMTDEPTKVGQAISLGRRTHRVVMQNVIMALSIKLAVLALGLLGLAGMWEAVFADVGAALLAVFNSMRVLKGNT